MVKMVIAPVEKINEDGEIEMVSAGIGDDGKEYGDPVPMAPPVGYNPPPTLREMIQTMIHHERLKQIADEEGFDSADEADDFDIEDDPLDPHTPYEKHFLPPLEKRAVVPPVAKEKDDGTQSDERGSKVGGDGDRGSDPKPKVDPGSSSDASVRGSGNEGDRGIRASEK